MTATTPLHMTGHFAPVPDEVDAVDLPVEGAAARGAAVFVPSTVAVRADDDGRLLTITTRRDGSAAQLLVLDAADVAGRPVAAVTLPRGVPSGFHGSRIADTELDGASLGATGLADGLVDGFADGLVDGFADGLADDLAGGLAGGLVDGLADGLAGGLADGLADGLAGGLVDGLGDGLADGERVGR